MTKKLFIIRHGKSDWGLNLPDFKRPLNSRGENQTKALGKHLKQAGILPDLILSSPAKRTQTTALNIAQELEISNRKIHFEPSIYLADTEQLLNAIWSVDNGVSNLFIVGHNPGVSELTSYITGEYIEFKTSCLAIVTLNNITDWENVQANTGKLHQYITPKSF